MNPMPESPGTRSNYGGVCLVGWAGTKMLWRSNDSVPTAVTMQRPATRRDDVVKPRAGFGDVWRDMTTA